MAGDWRIWSETKEVIKGNPLDFGVWMGANVGGILLAYWAAATVWLFHRGGAGQYLLPNAEVYLISGTVSLLLAGVHNLRVRNNKGEFLHGWIVLLWAFLVASVYGVLIAMSAKKPAIGNFWVFVVGVILFALCLIWALIIWCRDRIEQQQSRPGELKPPRGLSQDDLKATLDELPQLPVEKEEGEG